MISETNNNFKAIFIGFILITIVIGIMFFKFDRKKKIFNQTNIKEAEKLIDQTKSAKAINSRDLLQKISFKEKITVIDIRTSTEFKEEHLANSINMPLENFEENYSNLNKDSTYILVDSINSLEILNLVGVFLPEKGYKNIYYLDGGFSQWKNNFYPTISAGDPNSLTDQTKVTYINSEKLKGLLLAESHFFIIDVRSKKSFDLEHLPKAINIFVDDIEKKAHEIPLGEKVVVYDDDTFLAFQAAVRLFDLGKINVLTLSDGFKTWKEKNYPTEKTQP